MSPVICYFLLLSIYFVADIVALVFLFYSESIGGGLISGVALAAKAINPAIKVLAAEPRGADDAAQSKAAGEIVKPQKVDTIADGLRAFLGDLTW